MTPEPATRDQAEGGSPPIPEARRPVLEAYLRREAELKAQIADHDARSAGLSRLRLFFFLGTLGGLGYGLFGALASAGYAAAAGSFALFVFFVARHGALIAEQARLEARLAIVRAGVGRVSEREAEAGAAGPSPPPGHPYAGDLDVFGPRSLFSLISRARTTSGAARLASWLGAPAGAAEITRRQEAARELAAKTAFREDVELEAGEAAGSAPSPAASPAASPADGTAADPMVAWATRPSPFADPRARLLSRVAIALVAATLTLIVLLQLGVTRPLGLLRHAWALTLVLQLGIASALRPALDDLLEAASREMPFRRFARLFARLEEERFASPALSRISEALTSSGSRASAEMAGLERIVSFADFRHAGLVYAIVNALTLWDLFCALALDRWRRRAGARVPAYVDAVAEIEALASLGTFAHEHPDFAFPVVEEGPLSFEAEALGHPLLPSSRRVTNDFSLPAPGSAWLVTGSNMSGKSTMLRSVGVAAVLALAGAPVCARALRLSPLEVWTSMRISDSLERGVSHFYAELERLKGVVERANAGAPVLFLLDEILHGTNSRERHIGAEAIALHLVERGAVGALSSHDISLASLEDKSGGRIKNAHFEELVEGGRMSFDYKLKPGPVRTSNALRLMRLVGIDVPLPESAPQPPSGDRGEPAPGP